MIELKQSATNKRRNILKSLSVFIAVVMLFAIVMCVIYYRNSQVEYASYSEAAQLNYGVGLTSEGLVHYDEWLDEDQIYLQGSDTTQYIVKYINDVRFHFTYTLKIDKPNLQYQYEYSVEKVFVIKKNNNNIFVQTSEYAQAPITKSAVGGSLYMVNADAMINYNEYKNKVNSFTAGTGLSNYEAYVQVKLNVKIKGQSEELVKDINENAAITATIPIEVNEPDTNIQVAKQLTNKDGMISCIPNKTVYNSYKLIAIISGCVAIALLLVAIVYYLLTRTVFDVYHTKLNKITRNYNGYLTHIDGMIDLSDKKVLKVSKFTDLVEIRDVIQQPILFTTDEASFISNFTIIQQDMAFCFTLALSDMNISSEKAQKKAKEEKSDNLTTSNDKTVTEGVKIEKTTKGITNDSASVK